jgi:cytochrome c biogenesis protein CcdA
MAHLLGLVVLIGILDSLNPSTLAPALYIAGGETPHRSLTGFIAGVFVVNLAGGLVLALGPGQALLAFVPRPGLEVRHLIELGLGIGTFLVAGWLWLARYRVARRIEGKGERIDRSSLLVGAGISAAELPTAVPYFAVIAAVVDSGLPVGTQVGLIVIFNAVFVAPLLVILVARSLLGARGRAFVAGLRSRADRVIATAIPAIVLFVAVLLTTRGAVGLSRDHSHPRPRPAAGVIRRDATRPRARRTR